MSRDGAAVPDCGECVAVTENVAHNTGQLLYHAGEVRAGVVDCSKRVKVPDCGTKRIPTTSRTQPFNCLLTCFIEMGFASSFQE